jgi:valyl-tRNA synthetase
LFVKSETELEQNLYVPIVKKLGNLSRLNATDNKVDNSYGFIASNVEYFIPFTASIDMEEELARIQKEIEYTKGFLKSVMAKLGNDKFVANAKPEVVAVETKKKQDAEAKIKALEEQLISLSK